MQNIKMLLLIQIHFVFLPRRPQEKVLWHLLRSNRIKPSPLLRHFLSSISRRRY